MTDDSNIVDLRTRLLQNFLRRDNETHSQVHKQMIELIVQLAKQRIDPETILDVLLNVLVIFAGNQKINGASLLRTLAHEMDMCAAECWSDEFAEWFMEGVLEYVPIEKIEHGYEYYPEDDDE